MMNALPDAKPGLKKQYDQHSQREEKIGNKKKKINQIEKGHSTKEKGITSTNINHEERVEASQIKIPSPFCWC